MSITYVDRVEAATEETKGLVSRAESAAQEGIDAIKKRLTLVLFAGSILWLG